MPLLDRGISVEEIRRAFVYAPLTGHIYRKLGNERFYLLGHRAFERVKDTYKYGTFKGVDFLAHRVVWAIYYGEWVEEGFEIDHINGDTTDNRIENLRKVTSAENAKNLGRRLVANQEHDSGVNGVYWHRKNKKWVVRIKSGGKWTYFGSYVDLDEATSVRRRAEVAFGFQPNHGRRPSVSKKRAA